MYPNVFTNHVFYHGYGTTIPSQMNVVSTGVCKMTHGRRQLFSYEEDEQLKKLVEQFGEKDWKIIARKMPGRTTRQCRERYKNYLSPHIKNGPWTKEEDELLKEKYNEYGPHWSSISKFFKSRSDVNIKNRWSALSFHMNNNSNKINAFALYPQTLNKKSKVLFNPSQNFFYQEPNYKYCHPNGSFSMMPAAPYLYPSNMNQLVNLQPHQQIQPPANLNNIEKSNSDEEEVQYDGDDSNNDDPPSPPTNQLCKQQNQEIDNIANDSRVINVTPNSDNPISITSSPMSGSIIVVPSPVPMSVNFSGPLPPLLQKPKLQQHGQQSLQINSNSAIDSTEPIDQKRSISSPITVIQQHSNSPLSIDDNPALPSLISQQDEQKIQCPAPQNQIEIQCNEKDEEKKHILQHAQQSKEDIVIASPNVNNSNASIPITQILTPINPINPPPQISSSSTISSTISNAPLTIHKSQNQQLTQMKQATSSTAPASDLSLNSNFMVNFPFPQSLLSNSLLASNDQQESILASDARIDDASINTETEVLTNTFPNFGGRLW